MIVSEPLCITRGKMTDKSNSSRRSLSLLLPLSVLPSLLIRLIIYTLRRSDMYTFTDRIANIS